MHLIQLINQPDKASQIKCDTMAFKTASSDDQNYTIKGILFWPNKCHNSHSPLWVSKCYNLCMRVEVFRLFHRNDQLISLIPIPLIFIFQKKNPKYSIFNLNSLLFYLNSSSQDTCLAKTITLLYYVHGRSGKNHSIQKTLNPLVRNRWCYLPTNSYILNVACFS